MRPIESLMKWVWTIGLLLVVIVGGTTWSRWLPVATAWVDFGISVFRGVPESGHSEDDDHIGDHGDPHSSHAEPSSLELSAQAQRNIGLSNATIQPVQLETFRRSITVPAIIVEQPGRTRVQVATPMTGVITHVHVVQGEAVEPGTLLFQVRLTHEDLVNAQTAFIRTIGELEVEQREISRLREVTRSGAVAGKLLLERQYASEKLQASLRAQREALRLHGLSSQQIEQIASEGRLLRELQIFAPTPDTHGDESLKLTPGDVATVTRLPAHTKETSNLNSPPTDTTRQSGAESHAGPLILQQLNVHKGQSVTAGESLCVLTNYQELFIEGLAFEQDVSQLRHASENEWTVDAIFPDAGSQTRVVEGLNIAYLANSIDTDSRTMHFYVRLPNEVTKDRHARDNRYVEWKYLPGQRLQLRVPVEEWPQQIVLPVDAVAREGAESFVFQQNGRHFDRIPVHVKYRDQYSVVIDNDGSIFPGDVVAMRGAHQMQMALKNKVGGGVDPHAGHHH